MYQSIYCNRKTEEIFVWDDKSGMKQYPMSAFKYAYKRHSDGNFKSLYGEELTKVVNYNENDPELFESDVPIETRVLLDLYPDSDEPSVGNRVGVIDIEVSSEGGFPNMEMADKEITGISLYDYITRTCYSFILDKENKLSKSETETDPWYPKDWKETEGKEKIIILPFDDEDDLLISFMDKWQECNFTIISGWHVDMFDLPYLYLRIKNCLGIKAAKCLSPIGACYINGFKKTLVIGGMSVLDYILLYKKFSGKMEPTYALGPIGQKTVGIGKIQYHGNLNNLYKSDINKFLEYNITDVKIVVALDRKLKFIDLARNICHAGHVPYDNFHIPSKYLDGAILLYLKRNGGLIAPNKPAGGREEYEERLEEGDEGFSGAFVKEPVPGRYNWVFDLDIEAQYPSIIMSLNISPETKTGKINKVDYNSDVKDEKLKSVLKEIDEMEKKEKDRLWSNETEKEEYIQRRCIEFDMEFHVRGKLDVYYLGQTVYTKDEFMKLIEDSEYALSSNGIIYRKDKIGVIPAILIQWFKQRKELRKKAAEFKKAGDMEQYNFYNRRQQIYKVFLNSLYGVLGLGIFRFYDLDNAEATTATGVDIIQTTAKAINLYYNRELETNKNDDYVVYYDTDSCFVDAVPIIKYRYPNIDFKNEDEMTKAIMTVTEEVQNYVNKFYDIMAKRFFNLDKHRFYAKQEVISKSSFWLAKKRYVQWIIHEEGALLKEPRLEVKGIDIVRSGFPKSFQKFMKDFFIKLLTDSSKKELDDMILKFKENVKTLDVLEIAKNTSVKFVSQDGVHNYNPENRRPLQFVKSTPVAVKASLAYNDLLTKMGLEKQIEPIRHGEKIKWIYLQDNAYGLETMALKGDGNDADFIINFVNQYVDRNRMFEAELKSKFSNDKNQGIYDVLKWTFPNPSMTTASNFFDFAR